MATAHLIVGNPPTLLKPKSILATFLTRFRENFDQEFARISLFLEKLGSRTINFRDLEVV